jgi:predicted PurR-regulated permease PerM
MLSGVTEVERITKNTFLYWSVIVLILILTLYVSTLIFPLLGSLFIFLKSILAPFLIALIISYVLNPIVTILNIKKVPRPLAVLLIYVIFFSSLTIILMNTIPIFIIQLRELTEHLPELTSKAQVWMENYNDHKYVLPESIQNGIENSLQQIQETISSAISHFLNGITGTLDTLFLVFIVPFLAFYMMKDFKLIEKTVITVLPHRHRRETIKLLKNIDEALGSYIRGQFLVCIVVGILAYIGYWFIDLPYPLLMASFVALMNIIPYVGPFIGAAPALLLASTISWQMMIYVAIVNFVIQLLEGNVISPQIVGRTLHIHPLFIIFSLLVGGEVAGILGLILAVPFFAVVKVIFQHVFLHYVRR